jgi:hypothetical protein
MKKYFIYTLLFGGFLSVANYAISQCSQNGDGPCDGVCVGVWESGSTPSYYQCVTPQGAVEKDCIKKPKATGPVTGFE